MEYEEFHIKLKYAPVFTYEQSVQIPLTSGVYVAWLIDEVKCFYVGKSTSLRSRIRSHFSGQRGSDQFYLYVYDRYIHNLHPEGLTTDQVNNLTAKWIRKNIWRVVNVF